MEPAASLIYKGMAPRLSTVGMTVHILRLGWEVLLRGMDSRLVRLALHMLLRLQRRCVLAFHREPAE